MTETKIYSEMSFEIQRVIKKMNKHHMIGIDVIDDYIYDMQIGQKVYTIYLKE